MTYKQEVTGSSPVPPIGDLPGKQGQTGRFQATPRSRLAPGPDTKANVASPVASGEPSYRCPGSASRLAPNPSTCPPSSSVVNSWKSVSWSPPAPRGRGVSGIHEV